MSKIADKLRAIKIYNDYEITETGHPFLYMCSRDARGCLPAHVMLHIRGRLFKDAAWYETGGKMFSYSGREDKPKAIADAFAFVEKRFPGLKMVKSPFGGWVPEVDLKDKLEKAEEHLKGIGG